MELSPFQPFAFSFYLFTSSKQDGMARGRKKRRENKNEEFTVFDLLNTEIVKSVTIIYLLHKHIP